MNQQEIRLNVSLIILPFGKNIIKIQNSEIAEEKKELPANYAEPKTTDSNIVEINLDGSNYTTPKTTAGLL